MQDSAITEIGKLKGKRFPKPYQNFIQNMFPGKNYDMIVPVFHISVENGQYSCHLEKIEVEKVSDKSFLKYAYRKGSARGDITFTTILNLKDVSKSFRTFRRQVQQTTQLAEKFGEEKDAHILTALGKFLTQEANLSNKTPETDESQKTLAKTEDQITEILNNFPRQKQSIGFSIKFSGNSESEYLGDFNTIQRRLSSAGTSGKSEKYEVISEGKNELCSICLEKKPLLHGFGSPYKYATVDKPGFVSGFFLQKNNWKNYPICTDCSLNFELGQQYIAQNLSKIFFGEKYFLVPKVSIGTNTTLLKKAITTLEELDYKAKDGQKITSREEHLLRKIGALENLSNNYSLSLIFYEKKQASLRIKLFLDEIFPSRFRTLFVDAPNTVNKNGIFKNSIRRKDEQIDLVFSFSLLKFFFAYKEPKAKSTKKKKESPKGFHAIIQTTFLGLPISKDLLFSKIMERIRHNSKHSEHSQWVVLQAIMVIGYFKELNILPKIKNYTIMDSKNDASIPQKESVFDTTAFLEFFKTNQELFDFDSSAKAGVFGVGVLVRQVFNQQLSRLNNTPFENKLKGYHLNDVALKNIYLEALKKLSDYTSFNSFQGLRSFLNENFFLNSHKLKQLSNNELSFYFVAGLEFGNNFKTKKA